MNRIEKMCLLIQIKANTAKKEFKEFLADQRGISGIVVTLLILLIAILLVGLFWDRLSAYVTELMNKIFNADPVPASKLTPTP